MAENPRLKNTRTENFRYIYSNGLAAQMGPHEVTLVFGLKEDLAASDNKILEQVGVVMVHATAKLLATTLTKLIEGFEKTSGAEIAIEKSALDAVEKAISEAATTMPPRASPTA